MPRNPIDYSKCVFYKIVCKDITITDLYVGSTTDFKARKRLHKSSCSNENDKNYNLRVYRIIRDNGGWENWDMILIHRQSCIDSLEAHTIERQYVETLGANLNCQIPGRSKKEYEKANKVAISANRILYREENRDKQKEYMALYAIENKEKLIQYREVNKIKIKENNSLWCKENRDIINEKQKLAYHKRKLLKQESLDIVN